MDGTSRAPGPAGPPGLADLLNLFGSNNPLVSLARSVDQFRQTMESLNSITARVDRLLDDVEGPLRAMMPQLTRMADQASAMLATLSEPVDRVAPGLTQLADTLSNPAMIDLPRRVAETIDMMASVPKMLAPLGQMAEVAGGLFGGMRGLGLPGLPPRPAAVDTRAVSAASVPPRAPERAPATEPAAKKVPARKAAAKKTPAKKTAARKAPARSSAKKAAAKKAQARKAPAKRAQAKRSSGRTAKSARATFARSSAKNTGR